MEPKDLPIQLLQMIVNALYGTGYEPLVKLIMFTILLGVVVRFVTHPASRALAHTIWVGCTRAIRALERSSEYPPEVARRLEPVGHYINFVGHMCRVVSAVAALAVILLAFAYVAHARLTWDQILTLWGTFVTDFGKFVALSALPAGIAVVLVYLLRIALVSAFREWQCIKAGRKHPPLD